MEITKEYLEELIESCNGKKKTLREKLNINASGLQNILSKFDLLELTDIEKKEKELLYYYIYNKEMTVKEIAEKTGKSTSQVGGKIFKYALNKYVKEVEEINKEFLQREYIDKNRTSKDIADELGVTRARISSAIHRFGLSGNKVEEFPEHVTIEKVKELYIDKDYTKENTAKELGITFNQLDSYMRRNEISNLKGKGHSRFGELKLTEDYLQREYLEKKRSAYDISKEHDLTDCEIEYMLERYGLYGKKLYEEGYSKYSCNETKFSVEDPIFCYFAGLIATDGYIDTKNNRVVLRICNEGSKETLEKLAEYFEFTGEVREYPQYGNNNSGAMQNDLTIPSVKLIKELAKMGVVGEDKTFSLEFPKSFYNDDCAKMYMRGVVDGDGCIRVYKHSVGFDVVCASEEFIEGMIDFINERFYTSIQLTYHKSTANKRKYPTCFVNSSYPKEITEWVYTGYEEYRFKDKYEKFKRIV